MAHKSFYIIIGSFLITFESLISIVLFFSIEMTCQSCPLTRNFIQSSLNFKIQRFRSFWSQSIENLVLILSRSNTAQSANFKSHYQQYKLPHWRSQLPTLNWSNTTKINLFSKIFRGLPIFIWTNL